MWVGGTVPAGQGYANPGKHGEACQLHGQLIPPRGSNPHQVQITGKRSVWPCAVWLSGGVVQRCGTVWPCGGVVQRERVVVWLSEVRCSVAVWRVRAVAVWWRVAVWTHPVPQGVGRDVCLDRHALTRDCGAGG